MSRIPDISDYTLHRTVHDIDLEGVAIPGLTGEFFERKEGGRWATAGYYSFSGVTLFLSWGYRDELHCAWTAYRSADGTWSPPRQGCPDLEVVGSLIARPGAEACLPGRAAAEGLALLAV